MRSREPRTAGQIVPEAIKRKGYVAALSGAVLTLLIAIPLDHLSGQVNPFDRVALPLTLGIVVLLLVGFLRSESRLRRLELATFSVLALFFLAQLAFALYGPGIDPADVNDHLGEFGFWFPTLYAAMLFILGVAKGWRAAVVHFALTVAIGLPFIVSNVARGTALEVVYALSQLYLASAVLIIVMVVFARHTESLVRASADLERLAYTDAMTEIGNRRRLEHLLRQEVQRTERYGDDVSVLLVDVDRFKQVNDLHGHKVGDEVLRELAVLLEAESRAVDFVGRWGGEEFTLLLPNVDLEGTWRLAERLRLRIEAHQFATVGAITVSIGGAVFEPGESGEELMGRADRALYAAKAAGRNRVVMDRGRAVVARSEQEPAPDGADRA